MSSRRTLILLGAIALGVLAAFALFQYVNGIEDRIEGDKKPVDVFKAEDVIPRGTGGSEAIDAGLVTPGEINAEFRPEQSITTLDQINGKVAIFDIPAGVPITEGMFVDESETTVSFRRRLTEPNWVTATVAVDQVSGVAGLLVPGDEVNIMVAVDLTEGQEGAPPPGEGVVLDQRYEYLYQKVHILAIGQVTETLPGEETTDEEGEDDSGGESGLVTFNVPPDAAQLIASAQSAASLYLSLVPEDYEPQPIEPPPLTLELLPGQNADELTPYGPEGDGRSG